MSPSDKRIQISKDTNDILQLIKKHCTYSFLFGGKKASGMLSTLYNDTMKLFEESETAEDEVQKEIKQTILSNYLILIQNTAINTKNQTADAIKHPVYTADRKTATDYIKKQWNLHYKRSVLQIISRLERKFCRKFARITINTVQLLLAGLSFLVAAVRQFSPVLNTSFDIIDLGWISTSIEQQLITVANRHGLFFIIDWCIFVLATIVILYYITSFCLKISKRATQMYEERLLLLKDFENTLTEMESLEVYSDEC